MRHFTHNDSGENFDQVYPYSLIAYRYGKRVYMETFSIEEMMEWLDSDNHSAALVISPNGKSWKPNNFRWHVKGD